MSDIVLGALIGVGAAVIGSIITGVINYKNSKLQIGARRDELNQQLSYQEREAQRDRLIESRKDLLLRLRNTLSEWAQCSHGQVNMTVRLKNAFEKYDDASPSRQLEIREFNEVSERMKQLSSQFDILRGQVSDNKLDNLIEAVRETQYEVDIARMPLIRFFNNPSGADINSLESAFQKDESLRKEVSKQVLQVNRRIEELLSGEPLISLD